MSYLTALLAAEARHAGRGQRSATLRHRHFTRRPMGLLLWQLGAEPFTAAAVGYGFGAGSVNLVVPGEPLNRDLAFAALGRMAPEFNRWFESPSTEGAQQIVVPNAGNLAMLGRLGRALAYLPLDGPGAASPDLVRFGRHLQFIAGHARRPGQQLVVVVTELLTQHWVTELSALESNSLPALDAAIDPPRSMTGHAAAAIAERVEIGPAPTDRDDDAVSKLIEAFNRQRGDARDEKTLAVLRRPIEEHYRALVARGWKLMWSCLERERALPEAPRAHARWQEDVGAYAWHLQGVEKGIRVRTRQTSRQAAYTLSSWEDAQRNLVAGEAIDDPLRMVPSLLSNNALSGKVQSVDLENRMVATRNTVKRPLITVITDDVCTIPVGKELYWTKTPAAKPYIVHSVSPHGRTSRVVLRHNTSSSVERPAPGQRGVFSVHSLGGNYIMKMPDSVPWTHVRATQDADMDVSSEEAIQ